MATTEGEEEEGGEKKPDDQLDLLVPLSYLTELLNKCPSLIRLAHSPANSARSIQPGQVSQVI